MTYEMPHHLSPSGYSMWKKCPKAWWERYMEDHPREPATVEQVRGTFVHLVMERLLWLPAEHRTLANAMPIARTTFASWVSLGANAEFTSLALDPSEIVAFAAWTWQSIQEALQVVDATQLDVLATELKVAVDLGGVPFFGFIDVVTRDSADDWKTGEKPERGLPWTEKREKEKLAQPLLYAAALAELGHPVEKARLIYVPAEGRSGILEHDASDGALGAVVDDLATVWSEIEEAVRYDGADVDTHAGPTCGWCEFLPICQPGRGAVEERVAIGKNVGPGLDRMAAHDLGDGETGFGGMPEWADY